MRSPSPELASLALPLTSRERKTPTPNSLNEQSLVAGFEFTTTENQLFRWNIQRKVMQTIGHRFYHRAQTALLVDQLNGKFVHADHLLWDYQQDHRWQKIVAVSSQ